MNEQLKAKLRQHVEPSIVVNKGISQKLFVEHNIPAFIRDYFLKDVTNYQDPNQMEAIKERIKKAIPNATTWNRVLDQLKQGKRVKFLAQTTIAFDMPNDIIGFQIPEFGITQKQTYIRNENWEKFKDAFLNTSGSVWGVLELSYQSIQIKKKLEYRLFMEDFQYFAPFSVEVKHLINIRKNFTIEEWIDVLISGVNSDPDGFTSQEEKLTYLQRLLPFVENRLNIIELAPKGTGKTYLFSQTSNKTWWANGGVVTRAKFFYDMTLKTHGLVAHYDVLALDEISTLTFGSDKNFSEMQQALKGYLEFGTYSVGNVKGKSNCSFVLLGNVPIDAMNTSKNMVKTLPIFFQDSALLDRFHGFIEGWHIPRIKENMILKDFALSTEYLSEMFHRLREENIYKTVIEDLIVTDTDADTRDTTAIKRLASAYIKLFFPQWQSIQDVDLQAFDTYCLKPAIQMRRIIKMQMALLDPQFPIEPKLSYRVKGL